MSRRVRIAIGSVALIALVVILSLASVGHAPKGGAKTLTQMLAIAQAVRNYKEEYGLLPPRTDAELLATLTASNEDESNPRQIVFLSRIEGGEDALRSDAWGTPLRIMIGGSGVGVWSAGKDRVFSDVPGSEDDLWVFRPLERPDTE